MPPSAYDTPSCPQSRASRGRNQSTPTDHRYSCQWCITTWVSSHGSALFNAVNFRRQKPARKNISHLLKKLRKPQIQELVYQGLQRHSQENPPSKNIVPDSFGKWIANLPNLIVFDPDSGERPAILLSHIAWASYAKWRYSEQLEHFFCSGGNEFPDWIGYIYKLGRFYTAAKTLLKLAARQPDLVSSMRVEAIDAPSQVAFSVSDDETALMRVVQRLVTSNPEELMSRLGQFWVTEDPEARFRKACRLTLTVHAEMQLLSFYDHHPELAPRLAFMGTSKKTCFLCHEFMSRHPLAIGASACHQKLYPSWMPAPCSVANVRKEHKVLLWHLSQHLEQTAARDLQTRLGVRKPKSLDSTAGPSLSTTDNGAPKWWVHELATQLFRQKLSSSEELGPDKADG
ncbi:hypothetical protein AAL_00557 [Moelleriella libera RCEF 2490]|uniref:Uncharacterized protein n=1 Tax=Moelleriella libera RCEF 2490 TaxID=1081109 RepID=A0A166UY55_9HYPO|nr:hypothetical protein AAL_00557 [Moelleriella libera RCEF 2490]